MAKKYVLVLKGSPREKGNSSRLADRAAEGARAAGADVESFDLQVLNIQPCTACEACHETPEEGCIIEDGMRELYPRLKRADGILNAQVAAIQYPEDHAGHPADGNQGTQAGHAAQHTHPPAGDQ